MCALPHPPTLFLMHLHQQAWPNSLYSPPALIDAIAQRMKRPGGETSALWQALAYLYKAQGRPDLSLAIYLQLQLPSVFEFIQVGLHGGWVMQSMLLSGGEQLTC